MKTISPENDRSFVVNPEFRDNPEKWHACYMCAHTLVLVCVEVKSLKEAKRGNWIYKQKNPVKYLLHFPIQRI